MSTEIAMRLSGFLFLFIMITDMASVAFGNKIIGDLDSDAKLQKISNDPNQFKKSILIALIQNFGIIALAIMLFIAFGSHSVILGIVWITFRIGESLILFYNEKNYWGLLSIARQYSGTGGTEKSSLSDLLVPFSKQNNLDGHLPRSYSPLVQSHTQSCLLPMELYPQLLDGLELLPAFSLASVAG
jgi:hypothetical protein